MYLSTRRIFLLPRLFNVRCCPLLSVPGHIICTANVYSSSRIAYKNSKLWMKKYRRNYKCTYVRVVFTKQNSIVKVILWQNAYQFGSTRPGQGFTIAENAATMQSAYWFFLANCPHGINRHFLSIWSSRFLSLRRQTPFSVCCLSIIGRLFRLTLKANK